MSPAEAETLELVEQYHPMRVEALDVAHVFEMHENSASKRLRALYLRGLLEREWLTDDDGVNRLVYRLAGPVPS